MTNKIIGLIVVILILGAGFYYFSNSSKKSPTNTEVKNETTLTPTESKTTTKSYSLTEVANHSTSNDCWLVIEDYVYDVTKFIPNHPGGSEILKGCGKDATSIFNSRPNDGTSHSSRARDLLKNFLIGDLSK